MTDETENDKEDNAGRFPEVPHPIELPPVPKMAPKLPPHPEKPAPDAFKPGQYNKLALSTSAATSFIMPVIVLALGGNWLDHKFHTAPWLVMIGLLLGLVVGVSALMNILKRL